MNEGERRTDGGKLVNHEIQRIVEGQMVQMTYLRCPGERAADFLVRLFNTIS